MNQQTLVLKPLMPRQAIALISFRGFLRERTAKTKSTFMPLALTFRRVQILSNDPSYSNTYIDLNGDHITLAPRLRFSIQLSEHLRRSFHQHAHSDLYNSLSMRSNANWEAKKFSGYSLLQKGSTLITAKWKDQFTWKNKSFSTFLNNYIASTLTSIYRAQRNVVADVYNLKDTAYSDLLFKKLSNKLNKIVISELPHIRSLLVVEDYEGINKIPNMNSKTRLALKRYGSVNKNQFLHNMRIHVLKTSFSVQETGDLRKKHSKASSHRLCDELIPDTTNRTPFNFERKNRGLRISSPPEVRFISPVQVIYRTEQKSQPSLLDNKVEVAPKSMAPLKIDIDRLSRDVWNQIEKRIRIERERHGRL